MSFKPKISEKRWDISHERKLIELWEREKVYEFKYEPGKPLFVIDTPPPYASGSWHVAAAAHYSQMDMFARYYRMKGYSVFFPFGIDRNGLPVEIRVEKEYGIKAKEMDRSKFIELCRKKLDEYEKEIIEVVRRLGISARYWDPYRTDSPEYRAFTQATFIEMWKKGLIYEADRPTIWCPVCHTTIAEAEVEYVSRKGKLYYIRFPLKRGGYVPVATTRPELLGATVALLFNPGDERYKDLEGARAIIPIYNEEIPILSHRCVDMDFGSGVMMLSSFGDLTDIRLFRELGFKPKILIGKDGRMNELAGKYKGLTVEEARNAIVEDLDRMGLLEKVEEITQNIPVCWRSKNPVEFIVTRDLYIRQLEFKNDLLKLIDEIKFIPEFHKQLLINWINSISIDWPITRTRYYGTEVPIWYCRRCGHPHLPKPGKYYRPWIDPPPFDKCEKCGYNEFVGDPRTFDTWVDSSVTPLYITKCLVGEEFYEKAFPVTVRPQGIDIVRTWLYYTLLRVYLLTGKPAFKIVRLSGMGLDEYGRAMSKSLGNIVPPIPVIEKYGADAFRLWSATETKLGFDYRFSESKLESCRRFITKLWNVARFISSFPIVNEYPHNKLTAIDRDILIEVSNIIRVADREYSELDFFHTSNLVRNFIWNVFAPHYIELVKARAYNSDGIFTIEEQKSAWYALHTALKHILLVLHPIIPFITDYIWRVLYDSKGIIYQNFPKPFFKEEKSNIGLVMEFNSIIWRFKKSKNISFKSSLSKVITSNKLVAYEKDLKCMHNIKDIEFKDIEVKDTIIEL